MSQVLAESGVRCTWSNGRLADFASDRPLILQMERHSSNAEFVADYFRSLSGCRACSLPGMISFIVNNGSPSTKRLVAATRILPLVEILGWVGRQI